MLYEEYINNIPYEHLNGAVKFIKTALSVTPDLEGISKLYWLGATTRNTGYTKQRKLGMDDLAGVIDRERVIMLSFKVGIVLHDKPHDPTTFTESQFEIGASLMYNKDSGTFSATFGAGANFMPTKQECTGIVVEGSTGGSWWVPKPATVLLHDLTTAMQTINSAYQNDHPYSIATVNCPNPVDER